ncbi:MAG: hypothetical protein IPH65_17185 [Dehalococcoidia bacterium]|uniref:hypothetical protein n=1 Tax=Candidatus Amarobacter glycogenicus TaxID=3140699 RepID=UPI0031371C86|nr:hypothetical protein [Dehalococcoidia bacterium]
MSRTSPRSRSSWRGLASASSSSTTGGSLPATAADRHGPTAPGPNGTCPFSGQGNFYVQYIKGTGPGNFVAGLSAEISGADEAVVYVNASDVSQSLESNIAS